MLLSASADYCGPRRGRPACPQGLAAREPPCLSAGTALLTTGTVVDEPFCRPRRIAAERPRQELCCCPRRSCAAVRGGAALLSAEELCCCPWRSCAAVRGGAVLLTAGGARQRGRSQRSCAAVCGGAALLAAEGARWSDYATDEVVL